MAVSTATASAYLLEPRAHHIGTNYRFGHMDLVSRTLSDIIFLARVPNRATITDVWVRGKTTETACVYKLGITGNDGAEDTFGLGTISATFIPAGAGARPISGLGHKVSLTTTDLTAQSGATVYMTASSGSWTTSMSFDFCIAYVMEGAGND